MELVQPDLSVLVVILLVLSLYFILKRSFFNPINKILEDREAAIHGAQRKANDRLGEFEEKSRIYQDQLNAARQKIYRQQETLRSEALDQRAGILAKGTSGGGGTRPVYPRRTAKPGCFRQERPGIRLDQIRRWNR